MASAPLVGGQRGSPSGSPKKDKEVAKFWRLPGNHLQISMGPPSAKTVTKAATIFKVKREEEAVDEGGPVGPVAPTLTLAALREVTATEIPRVIDIFRQFDDSGDGKVDGIEFLKAMRELGLSAPEESVAAVFVRRRLCHSRHVQARTR